MEDSSAPVLVLATSATTRSGTYARLLSARIGADKVLTQACPLLVPMIEEGWLDHPILHQTIHEYVAKYADKFPSGVGLLACTHYPWIHTAFERALPGWKIVNSAQAVVRALERRGIVGLHSEAGRTLKPIHWIFTDPAAVPDFAKRLVEE
jgi:glutamate racemase